MDALPHWWRRALFAVVATAGLAAATHDGAGEARPRFVTGRLLVAAEQLADPNFTKTVVYMISHDSKGALGTIVNRRLGAGPLDRLLAGFGIDVDAEGRRVAIHWGGPVENGYGFVLHTDDFKLETTKVTGTGVAWTPSAEPLKAVAEGGGPKRYLFTLGYAGWAPGQLESEIRRGDWLIVPADDDLVFGDDNEAKWKRATAKAKIAL